LLNDGWRVGIVWECILRGRHKDIPGAVDKLAAWLRSDARIIELRGPALSASRSAIKGH
jgi:DNA mismatch endonuclease (patch repair protein)